MSIENLLDTLNENQRIAATFNGTHALVLAGSGTGKTRTIIARAGYLIHSGVPADRIQVLTFTRRSAKEIVERVKVGLGDRAEGLRWESLLGQMTLTADTDVSNQGISDELVSLIL